MDLTALAYRWYVFTTGLNRAVADPLMGVSGRIGVPIVAALLLGLLASSAPCQITTNASAIAFVSRRIDTPRAKVRAVLAYLLGKVTVYSILGAVMVLAGRQVVTDMIPAIVVIRKLFGPLMIVLGLYFLGVLRLRVSFGQRVSGALWRYAGRGGGARGDFLLGAAYSCAFCPTMFWLFFGLMIPLALQSSAGVVYPSVFALGTALPFLAMTALLSVGIAQSASLTRGTRRMNRVLGVVAGVVFLLAGLNDTFVYWLF